MTTKSGNQGPTHDTEVQVLGALLADTSAIYEIMVGLAAADFLDPSHAKIYAAMLRLAEKNKPTTVTTVANALGHHLDSVGGTDYLHMLWCYSATALHLTDHAALIRGQRKRRDLVRICKEGIRVAGNDSNELPETIDGLVEQLLSISHDPTTGQMVDLRDELGPAFKAAEQASRGNTEASGLSTGFVSLDAIIGGLKSGNIVLLAARPSMGKSAMAMNIAASVVGSTEKTVLIFNLEMSARELTYRLVAAEGDLDTQRMMRGKLDGNEWGRFGDACNAIEPLADRLRVLDQCYLTPAIMRAHMRREMRRADIGLVVVDYLQLMASGRRRENQNVEIAAISRGLKILSRDFNVPILALSQLNRGIENRSNPLPRLADLRDSGSLEQDADCVIFIHRDENSANAKIIVAKQRNGPKGTIELHWDAKSIKFRDVQEAVHA